MWFTTKEKQAIVKVSNMMIGADGKVDPKEVLYGFAVLQKLNISQQDVSDSDQLTNQEALSIISAMQPNEKRMVGAFLGCIMAVDGQIDKTEHTLWCLITSLCSLPNMSLSEAIEEMQKL